MSVSGDVYIWQIFSACATFIQRHFDMVEEEIVHVIPEHRVDTSLNLLRSVNNDENYVFLPQTLDFFVP